MSLSFKRFEGKIAQRVPTCVAGNVQSVIGRDEQQQQSRRDVKLRPRTLAALAPCVWRMKQVGRICCADAAPRQLAGSAFVQIKRG